MKKKFVCIHKKYSDRYEVWYDYDESNNLIHKKDSTGFEIWKDYNDEDNLVHMRFSTGNEVWYEYKEIIIEEDNLKWENSTTTKKQLRRKSKIMDILHKMKRSLEKIF